MTKASAIKSKPRRARTVSKGGLVRVKASKAKSAADHVVVTTGRVEAVMRAAAQSGLLSPKGDRIGGRVSPALIRQAKRQTGIEADTDLIEFALAAVALDDNFAKAFKESRGKVDPTLKLGF